MAAKRTLNAKNLETLGAAALAELLIEVSAGNAVIQRRLRLALASADGAGGASQEVRKRLAAIHRSTTFIDAAKRKALLADLEAQLQAITGPIAAADPSLALELLVRFLALADGVLDRCSDTTGAVFGVFHRGVNELGPLATKASISPQALAEIGADLLRENGYCQFDGLIPALGPVLGEAGLAHLEVALLERGGIDRLARTQILQARGDVDGYLELFTDDQLSWPDTAADVATHLLQAGRAQQALAVLDHAADVTNIMEAQTWHDTRITVLEALGRKDEAQDHRWEVFRQSLSIPTPRDYLNGLDDFADVEAEERAFWVGDAYEIYEPAAERLSADHPLAATLLLRAMVGFALSMGRSKRYRYAVEHLRQCERLEVRIDDWWGFESHASFLGRLREAFGRNWSFWSLLER